MMRPLFCSRIKGAAWRVQFHVPFRWVAMTASHSASLMLKIIRSRRMPATFTRMSSRPKLWTAMSMMFSRRGEVRHRVVARRSLAAGGLDLACDLVGGLRLLTGAVDRAAEIVDHHRRALLGEQDRDASADAASRSGDDGDLALQML